MSLPHVLKRIRLELARSKEFPMGSANHGYSSPAGQSTRNGCSITIQIRPTTTKPDIASGCTPSHPASMFQSVIMRVRPTPSR